MDHFGTTISSQIEKHVNQLKNQALVYQQLYTKRLNEEANTRQTITRGYFPRVRDAPNFGFYIYWDKYPISHGKTILSTKDNTYRISKSIPKNKTDPMYPAASFNPDRLPDWELAIILAAEADFAIIRREATHWMKVMKQVKRGPVCN